MFASSFKAEKTWGKKTINVDINENNNEKAALQCVLAFTCQTSTD